jgi:hypothetical protein
MRKDIRFWLLCMFQTNCVGFQKESEGFGFTQVKVKGNAYSEPSSGQVMVWDNTNIGKMIKVFICNIGQWFQRKS